MPFGQGHSAYGQFAAGRGANPTDLLTARFNEAGDLAFAGMKVHVEKTGRKRSLSRCSTTIEASVPMSSSERPASCSMPMNTSRRSVTVR